MEGVLQGLPFVFPKSLLWGFPFLEGANCKRCCWVCNYGNAVGLQGGLSLQLSGNGVGDSWFKMYLGFVIEIYRFGSRLLGSDLYEHFRAKERSVHGSRKNSEESLGPTAGSDPADVNWYTISWTVHITDTCGFTSLTCSPVWFSMCRHTYRVYLVYNLLWRDRASQAQTLRTTLFLV